MKRNTVYYRLSSLFIAVVLLVSALLFSTACTPKSNEPESYLVEEDTSFAIILTESSIMGLPFNLFIDRSSSIVLRTDGTATITIKTTRALSGLANTLLSQGLAGEFLITPFVEMALEYIPGFSLIDMQSTFGLVQTLLGLTLVGFDWTDPEIEELFNTIHETGKLPAELRIPNSLTLEYTANYYIKDVASPYSGAYSGIYMGDHASNGEPFILMDLREDDNGDKKINLRIELVKLIVNASEIFS